MLNLSINYYFIPIGVQIRTYADPYINIFHELMTKLQQIWSISGGVAVCCVLPVLWTTSFPYNGLYDATTTTTAAWLQFEYSLTLLLYGIGCILS